MIEEVILVNEKDEIVGIGEKMQAHLEGKLHRAFSIFVFDSEGRLLLQKRATGKYHSGDLWSNTCCSHPRPGETTLAAAHRRLREEMGFDCELQKLFEFTYTVKLGDNLFEHEYDHVFVGFFDGEPSPDAAEVSDWRRVDLASLAGQIDLHQHLYTYWLREAVERMMALYPDGRIQCPA
jgi:isopentenyl-diphosphate delta-isomerase